MSWLYVHIVMSAAQEMVPVLLQVLGMCWLSLPVALCGAGAPMHMGSWGWANARLG
jgi:hypothetical protein